MVAETWIGINIDNKHYPFQNCQAVIDFVSMHVISYLISLEVTVSCEQCISNCGEAVMDDGCLFELVQVS